MHSLYWVTYFPVVEVHSNPPVCAPKQNGTGSLENKIRQPDNQVWREFSARGQRFAEKDEAVINQHEAKGDGHAYISFTPMNADAERNADERESEARERKRDLPVHLDADRLGQIISLFFGFIQFRAPLSRICCGGGRS